MITLNEIRQVCHAGKVEKLAGGGMLERSYLLHRELGGWLTFIFLNFLPFVRPNHVSMLMVLAGFAGCLCFSMGSNSAILAGCSLLYFSFLLDKVDGDIARYRKCYSSFGKFLDEIYHLFPQTCVYLGLGLGVDGGAQYGFTLWLGIVGMLAAMFNRIAPKLEALIRFDVTNENKNEKIADDIKPHKSHPIGVFMGLATRFDLVILIIAVASILEIVDGNKIDFVLIAFTLLIITNILRMLVIIKGVNGRLL